MNRLVVTAACLASLVAFTVRAESAALLDDAQRAYDADQFAAAADSLTNVLATATQQQDVRQAAYLLSLILLFQDGVDTAALIAAEPELDAGLHDVVAATRTGDLPRAAEMQAYLRFREHTLPLATRRLLSALESRIGGVATEYARAWEREIAHAVDVAVGDGGNVWVLVTDPPAFVRMDRRGEIVERVAFTIPETLDASGLRNAHFVVRQDGSFQLGSHRYGADGTLIDATRVYAPVDVAAMRDGTTVFLHDDGLRAVDASGGVEWQRLGRGRRFGSFNHPAAVTRDADGLVVAEMRRLQCFSESGEPVAMLDPSSGALLPEGFKLSGITDVAAAAGRLFTAHMNARTVDVYSADFKPIAIVRITGSRIAATSDGLVLALKNERLSVGFRVPEHSREIALNRPEPLRVEPPDDEPAQTLEQAPIEFIALANAPPNVRIHASTRHVTSLARGHDDLWIGTYGGLLRWQPAQHGADRWEHWSRMQGFPSDVVHDVHVTRDGAVWVITNGAVLVRAPGTDSWRQLHRDGFAVNGKSIIGDGARPDYVWVAAQRGLLHLKAASETAGFVPMTRGPDEIVQLADGRLFARLGVDGVASVDAATGQSRVLVEMEDLERLPGLRNPARDRWIMTLSADPGAGVVWIGTNQRELAALEPDSGELLLDGWIDGALDRRCRQGTIRAQRIAGALHVLGQGCHGVQPVGEDQVTLVLTYDGRGQDLIAADGALILGTTDGLFRLQHGIAPTRIQRPGTEPPDWAPKSLTQVDGRVWVGYGNRGVGIYDGNNWREVTEVSSVDRFRAQSDDVLAIASFGDGRVARLTCGGQREAWVAPGGRSWTFLRDLYFDGDTWWAAGAPHKSRAQGIRVWREGREEHWGRQAGMPFGEARRILADPNDDETLWLATDAGLVRLNKRTRRASVVWPGDLKWLESFGTSTLWAYGSDLVRYDTRTGLGSPAPYRGLPAPDPSDPKALWLVHENGLLKIHAETGEPLARVPVGLGTLTPYGLEIVADEAGASAWIAGFGGLFEVRLPPGSAMAKR